MRCVTSKRGDLLALGLARLRRLAPRLQAIGLSATVAEPDAICARWLSLGAKHRAGHGRPHHGRRRRQARHHHPRSAERVPWAGHTARYAIPEIYEAIKRAQD